MRKRAGCKGRVRTLILLVTIGVAGNLGADSRASETWLLYEQGNAAIASREYGKALELMKEAILRAGVFPEAELAVGDIYMEEGEVDLAQAQYEKAYNLRKYFTIPDMQYDVLYRMATLSEGQELYKRMEDSLLTIVSDDRHFNETQTSMLRTQLEKNYFEKGIDRVLVLYSFAETFSVIAHSKLGWFYYRTGRYTNAVSHLLYAVVYRMSQVERYLRDRDVDFQFSTLSELLTAISTSKELSEYVSTAGVYKDLYYLSGATFANGYPELSRMLWKLLSTNPAAGQYQALSARQLKSPSVEPLLGASP